MKKPRKLPQGKFTAMLQARELETVFRNPLWSNARKVPKIRTLSSIPADHRAFIGFAGWRSHEFWSNWIANCFAQNRLDSSDVAFR